MHAGNDVFLCPNPEALVFCGAVPLCQIDEIDPVVLTFLADCAASDRDDGAGLPTIVMRSMTCGEASALMGEVCHGRS